MESIINKDVEVVINVDMTISTQFRAKMSEREAKELTQDKMLKLYDIAFFRPDALLRANCKTLNWKVSDMNFDKIDVL